METLNVLFVNCMLESSPELGETEVLWRLLVERYQAAVCNIDKLRPVDFNILPGHRGDMGMGDEFLSVFDRIRTTDILILGIATPYWSECQKLIERLRAACLENLDLTTGQSPLYNTVVGALQVGDVWGGTSCLAKTFFDLGQLGCVNPPYNAVIWYPAIDTQTGFTAAKGQTSVSINRQVRLLAEHTLAIAHQLRKTPLQTNLRELNQVVQTIARDTEVKTSTLLKPQPIVKNQDDRHKENWTVTNSNNEGISYRHLSKRIWTVMQAGKQRGFKFQVVSLKDKIFRAERDGKGFLYKIYPGYFSYRQQYINYDVEKSKTHKLALMDNVGLPVPQSYGSFKTVGEIPFTHLTFPLVAKPDAGSLSENVYANVQNAHQLEQVAAAIEAEGALIKLESRISGQDYRVLIIDHRYAGCVQRRPASVTGDGQHTILELFYRRNREPGRCDRDETHTTLHQLVFDHTSRQQLHDTGYTLDTVLEKGTVFYLQEKITAALGADYIDFTNELHPSSVEYCIEFSHHYPCLTLGFDLITIDIRRPLAETGGAFNEYNTLPYVDLHENCNVGQQRPVSALIWDYIENHGKEIVTTDFSAF